MEFFQELGKGLVIGLIFMIGVSALTIAGHYIGSLFKINPGPKVRP